MPPPTAHTACLSSESGSYLCICCSILIFHAYSPFILFNPHQHTSTSSSKSKSQAIGHSSIQDLYSTCLPVREDERNVDLKLGGVPCAAPQQRTETVTSRTHQEDADESTSLASHQCCREGVPRAASRGRVPCAVPLYAALTTNKEM